MDLPNGTYTTYTYSNRNWVTAITHKKSDDSTFLSFSYQHDKCGNSTKLTENNGDVTDYTYDALYRLTRETKEDDQQSTLYDYSYTYDAVGNRTKKTDEETQTDTNYTYNKMNEMTAAGNISYTYDDAGNMETKVVNQETTTYVWDFRNKMVKVDFPTGDDPVMRYDGDGREVKKVVGATATHFLCDARVWRPVVLFDTDGSGNETAEYRRDVDGALLAMERNSTLYWYHFDAVGSTRGLSNSSETATDTYAYDGFGNVMSSTGSTRNPYRLNARAGWRWDADIGLSATSWRYYAPGEGGCLTPAHPAACPAGGASAPFVSYALDAGTQAGSETGGEPVEEDDPLWVEIGKWIADNCPKPWDWLMPPAWAIKCVTRCTVGTVKDTYDWCNRPQPDPCQRARSQKGNRDSPEWKSLCQQCCDKRYPEGKTSGSTLWTKCKQACEDGRDPIGPPIGQR